MEQDTINRIFLDNARIFQDDTIIKYKREKGGKYIDLTWRELKEVVTSFAAGLIRTGIMPGDRVAILSWNRIEWIVSDMGSLLAAGVIVPIYHTNTPDQCAYIINDSDSKFIVVEDQEQLDKILLKENEFKSLRKIILIDGKPPVDNDKVISYSSLLEMGRENMSKMEIEVEERSNQVKPEDMATIVYTSGTTGPPKGCMISHMNTTTLLKSIHEAMGIDPKTNLSLLFLPLSHNYPRNSGYYYSIYKNVTLALAESIDTLAQNLAEIRPTFICSVPRIWEKIYSKISTTAQKGSFLKRLIFRWAVNSGRERSRRLNAHEPLPILLKLKFKIADLLVFKKIRNILGGRLWFVGSAGAPLLEEIGEFFHSIGIQFVEFYGLTETNGGTMTTLDECRYGTVGKPIPGIEVKLALDGEILMRGNNFMGYCNKPELTKEFIVDGWCYTGDVGRWDEDGFLILTDRKKDLIITSGGKNISPQNIENMIKSTIIPLVSNTMVYGDRKNYLTALITLDRIETEVLARENNIQYNTYEELTQSPEIMEFIREGIDQVNSNLAKFETIKKFAILERDFSQEDGEVTPTLKVKRKIVTEKFRDVLESMYGANI